MNFRGTYIISLRVAYLKHVENGFHLVKDLDDNYFEPNIKSGFFKRYLIIYYSAHRIDYFKYLQYMRIYLKKH